MVEIISSIRNKTCIELINNFEPKTCLHHQHQNHYYNCTLCTCGNNNSSNSSSAYSSFSSCSTTNKNLQICNNPSTTDYYNSYDSASDVTYFVKLNTTTTTATSSIKSGGNASGSNHYSNLEYEEVDDVDEDVDEEGEERTRIAQQQCSHYLRTKCIIVIPPPEIKNFEQWRKRQKERREKRERQRKREERQKQKQQKQKAGIVVVGCLSTEKIGNKKSNAICDVNNKSRLISMSLTASTTRTTAGEVEEDSNNYNSNYNDDEEDEVDSGDEIEEQEVIAFVAEFPYEVSCPKSSPLPPTQLQHCNHRHQPPTSDYHQHQQHDEEEEPESLYAEPVYNEMSNNGSQGGSSSSTSYWTPIESMPNQSSMGSTTTSRGPNTVTAEASKNNNNKSDSIYSYDPSSNLLINNNSSSKNPFKNGLRKTRSVFATSTTTTNPTPSTTMTTQGLGNNNNVNGSSGPSSYSSSSYYDMSAAELPPIPTNSSSTKFSTIAKTAGKKLAKKLQYIRKLSKSSLEGFELPTNLSLFNNGSNNHTNNGKMDEVSSLKSSCSSTSTSTYSTSNMNYNHTNSNIYSSGSHNVRTRSQSIGNISCNGISTKPMSEYSNGSLGAGSGTGNYSSIGTMKRSISRPNIPPPKPPPLLPLPSIPTTAAPQNKEPTFTPMAIGTSQPQPIQPEPDYEEDDDFDDSDFYDSDSELIRNFVAAVQPIYSMEEEPLYQYYTYGISLEPEDNYQPIIPKNLGLTLDMLVPRTGQRTLWCELPEVISSGILLILSDKQKQLQEAIFEILTSEVSYLKSLDVLISLFYENDQLIQVLSENDRASLFGNITYVKDCAQTFLTELLAKWEASWYIQDVGQVIHDNANTRFGVYKEYCRNKPYQDKTLQRLRSTNDEFVNIIKSIEENPKCQLLRMDSFLMLPMQRITRLPLLVNAIIQRAQNPKEKAHCEDALKSLTNLVIECNEAARESQDAEETSAILDKIEFPKGVKSITNPGQFLMKCDFMRNPFDHQGKSGVAKINWTFQKNKRVIYWLILFSNQLFVTKKKSVDKFEVIDMVSPIDTNIKPLPNLEGLSKDFQHYFMLHFDRKEVVYFLAARTQAEVDKWKQKLEQLKTTKELKVEAIFPYEAKRPDELSFTVGQIIKVDQMQPDGWYYGTKVEQNDGSGVSGWFPGNYCAEC